MGKIYKFDYIKDMVDKWADKTTVTRQQLNMIPYCITLPWLTFDSGVPSKDFYDEEIVDFNEWLRQREKYLDNLWKDLGSYSE